MAQFVADLANAAKTLPEQVDLLSCPTVVSTSVLDRCLLYRAQRGITARVQQRRRYARKAIIVEKERRMLKNAQYVCIAIC